MKVKEFGALFAAFFFAFLSIYLYMNMHNFYSKYTSHMREVTKEKLAIRAQLKECDQFKNVLKEELRVQNEKMVSFKNQYHEAQNQLEHIQHSSEHHDKELEELKSKVSKLESERAHIIQERDSFRYERDSLTQRLKLAHDQEPHSDHHRKTAQEMEAELYRLREQVRNAGRRDTHDNRHH